MPNTKLISVVIPFYNESVNLLKIFSELKNVIDELKTIYHFEIILMDNHSSDDSFDIAKRLFYEYSNIKLIRLSRNFGYQANILTGFKYSTGDAVVQLDADGEDDPQIIKKFISEWERGYKVVYGIRLKRAESIFLSAVRKIFYRMISFLAEFNMPVDSGDFRLIDKEIIGHLLNFEERTLYIRGLIASIGFEQKGIPYERRARYKGVSKFSLLNYISFAVDGVTSFTIKPLRMASFFGVLLSIASFFGLIFYFWLHFYVGTQAHGFTTIVLLQLGLAGIQLICLGVMGSYIGRIYLESKRRPISIVESIYGPEIKSIETAAALSVD